MTDLEKLKELYSEDGLWGLEEDTKTVLDGDWISEGKYEYKTTVVEYNGNYYQIDESRSGSYFSDYHYSDSYIQQVLKSEKTVVKTVWTPTGEKVEVERD